MTDDLCQCPNCGRLHRNLGFGKPPHAISSAGSVTLPRALALALKNFLAGINLSESEPAYRLKTQLAAALASRPAEPSPSGQMESAPKDGTRILILGEDGWCTGSWVTPDGFNPIVSALSKDAGGYFASTGSVFPIRYARGWQPLPPIPGEPK